MLTARWLDGGIDRRHRRGLLARFQTASFNLFQSMVYAVNLAERNDGEGQGGEVDSEGCEEAYTLVHSVFADVLFSKFHSGCLGWVMSRRGTREWRAPLRSLNIKQAMDWFVPSEGDFLGTEGLGEQRRDDAAGATVVAELAEVNALPCAGVEVAVGHGDGERHSGERAFGVAGHVVGPFVSVEVIWGVFGHQAVVDALHVMAHVGVVILVYAQCAACMFDKQVEESRAVGKLDSGGAEGLHDFACDEVEATTLGL